MNDNAPSMQDHLSQSMNAILLLNSSCQAIVETYIEPSDSTWYRPVADDLHNVQVLVRKWRLSGFLYFSQTILLKSASYASTLMTAKTLIESLFDALSKNFNPTQKQELVTQLNNLLPSISDLNNSVDGYLVTLRAWSQDVAKVHDQLLTTINAIQQQESQLQADITTVNLHIDLMQQTIETDRQAIAKARETEKRGIIETIFGIIFAPFTGGLSLILAGIGVATITEGEVAIAALKNQISTALQKIIADQSHLNDDEKQIVNLQGISSSANVVMSDVTFITESLDDLRVDWSLLDQNLNNIINKINLAENSEALILSKVWFEAACIEWESVQKLVESIINAPVQSNRINVG